MSNGNVLKFPASAKKPTLFGKYFTWMDYFETARGRNLSQYFIGAVAIAVGTAFYSYQTVGIKYYLNYIRSYRDETPVEVPEEIEILIDTASDKLKLSPREAANLKAFMVSGFDIKSVGSLKSLYSGWIGIPPNYLYKSTADVDRINTKVGTEAVKWDSASGEKLEKSLVLTEDEKTFGILRSILELRNHNYIHNSLIPVATIYGLYTTSQYVNGKYNLFRVRRIGRVLVYGALSAIAYGFYAIITDSVIASQSLSRDKQLAALGADIVEAGIRFYEKVLAKNTALRELGEMDSYTAKGDVIVKSLRFDLYPLTARKVALEQALKEIHKKEAQEKESKAAEESQQKTSTK